jgi:RecA/RadA recombinase
MVERVIFINYRSEDSHSYGALLYRDLTGHFGKDLVFLDSESIPGGADFVEELLGRVQSARVLLAVIGQHWLAATDPTTRRRRIDDPADWVRREIAEAFIAGVQVIPILTDQAELPRETDLPADIAALSRCQYRRLRNRESTSDLARIVTDLTSLDPELAAATPFGRTTEPVDELLQLLATASRNQWTAAANDRRLLHPAPLPIRWRRSSAPVAGPPSAAAYARFDPLPGLPAISELHDGDKDALHGIYGGLPSGRLLLIGPPGSGKTAAAILLLLDALRYREHAAPENRARIPVPVLFTLPGWDPIGGTSVTDWMAGKLAETYPMFRSRAGHRAATDLLNSGRVAGFLDGLDEIPETTRPGVLAALADAPFRLVLLTRTEEAVAAAQHRPLAGAVAVELLPVQPTDAATYLLEPLVDPPPAPWQKIRDHLIGSTDHSALSDALNTPLALTLLRDGYGPTDPVDELLDTKRFPTAADIETHLLDRAITAAYTPRPGHRSPRYSVDTAHRTLRYLATQLTEHGTRDLAWWHIPIWTTHRSRMIGGAVGTVKRSV